jgi:hypothetical protein
MVHFSDFRRPVQLVYRGSNRFDQGLKRRNRREARGRGVSILSLDRLG